MTPEQARDQETWNDMRNRVREYEQGNAALVSRCDKLEAELARLRPLAEAGERLTWQPIETAPKDGSLILLTPSRCWAVDVNADCEVGYWDDDFGGKWISMGSTAEDYTGPTHWMPLSNPPALRPAEAPAPTKENT